MRAAAERYRVAVALTTVGRKVVTPRRVRRDAMMSSALAPSVTSNPREPLHCKSTRPGDTISASNRGSGSAPTASVRTSTIRPPSAISAPATRRPATSNRPLTENRLWPLGDSVFIVAFPSYRRSDALCPDNRPLRDRAGAAAPRGPYATDSGGPSGGPGGGPARGGAGLGWRPGVPVPREGQDARQRPAGLRGRLRLDQPDNLLLGRAH